MTYDSPFPALAGRAYAFLKYDYPNLRDADIAAWIVEYERVMFGAPDRSTTTNSETSPQN